MTAMEVSSMFSNLCDNAQSSNLNVVLGHSSPIPQEWDKTEDLLSYETQYRGLACDVPYCKYVTVPMYY